ncbi:hypothetical protein V8G54_026024 [Vigna mungo]|uniref:Uncharacterized protein n=1 Tax=Vigna mungo TaxID=3915 RepID=A0AAQ3MY14_VIGMU
MQFPRPKKRPSISIISFSLPTKYVFLGKGKFSCPCTLSFCSAFFLPSLALKIPAAFAMQLRQLPSLASILNSLHFISPSIASLHSLSIDLQLRRAIISAGPVSNKRGIKFFF